ncbi:MAG: hypothetical protein ACI9M1_001055 [Porticoccaceae bacterium]|jgi:hypothetical protein
MKTILVIIAGFKNILGLNAPNATPQLIAIAHNNFCQNLAIMYYYCDENNLFI